LLLGLSAEELDAEVGDCVEDVEFLEIQDALDVDDEHTAEHVDDAHEFGVVFAVADEGVFALGVQEEHVFALPGNGLALHPDALGAGGDRVAHLEVAVVERLAVELVHQLVEQKGLA